MSGWRRSITPRPSPEATARLCRRSSARHARWPTSWPPSRRRCGPKGEAMIQQADKLLCESWNERMWSDGEPIDPSPTIDQAVNGGFPWLEIRCARCKTPSDVDLAAMKHPPTTFVHDLASRLRCRKCAKAGRRPVRDPATIGLAAAPSSNRNLTDVQSLLDHDQPGRHHRAVSRREPIRRQPGADARRVSRITRRRSCATEPRAASSPRRGGACHRRQRR